MHHHYRSVTLRLIVLALVIIFVCKFSCGPTPAPCISGKVVKKSRNLVDTLLTGPGNNLYCINMLNPGIGYVSGEKGTILKTLNGGNNWVAQTSGTGTDLMGIYTLDADSAVTVGKGGLVLRSTNKGVLWNSFTSGTAQDLNSVFFSNKDTGYACGNAGIILKTNNGGFNWTTQATGTVNNLYCINFISKDTGVAVGQSGKIMRTVNGGTNWTGLTGPVLKDLHGVDFIDSKLMAVGDSGRIILSTDYGASWTTMTSPTGLNLRSIIWCMQKIAYAVGDSGVDLRYNGISWAVGPRGTNKTLNFVHSPFWKKGSDIRLPTSWKVGNSDVCIDNNPDSSCSGSVISLINTEACNWCLNLRISPPVDFPNFVFSSTCFLNYGSCSTYMNTGGYAQYESPGAWISSIPLNSNSITDLKLYNFPADVVFPVGFRFYLADANYETGCYIELDDIKCCDADVQKH